MSTIVDITARPIQFRSGATVMQASADLAQLASASKRVLRGEFNGTPIEALPGDAPRHVAERWALEREIYQLRNGIKT
jgi:hypothetical protein